LLWDAPLDLIQIEQRYRLVVSLDRTVVFGESSERGDKAIHRFMRRPLSHHRPGHPQVLSLTERIRIEFEILELLQ